MRIPSSWSGESPNESRAARIRLAEMPASIRTQVSPSQIKVQLPEEPLAMVNIRISDNYRCSYLYAVRFRFNSNISADAPQLSDKILIATFDIDNIFNNRLTSGT